MGDALKKFRITGAAKPGDEEDSQKGEGVEENGHEIVFQSVVRTVPRGWLL